MLLFTAKFFWYIFTFQIYKGKIIQKLRFQGTSPGQKVIISVSFYTHEGFEYDGRVAPLKKKEGNNNSSQIDGGKVETVTDLTFLVSKITVDGKCSHEIERCLLFGRKAMTNLDSILKSRDITLPTKVHTIKAMAFQVVMYGCESWTIKKAECRRIDTFELWCWRKLSRVPWTAKRSNQSVLKEINPEYSLEGLMLKLKFQYFDQLM